MVDCADCDPVGGGIVTVTGAGSGPSATGAVGFNSIDGIVTVPGVGSGVSGVVTAPDCSGSKPCGTTSRGPSSIVCPVFGLTKVWGTAGVVLYTGFHSVGGYPEFTHLVSPVFVLMKVWGSPGGAVS